VPERITKMVSAIQRLFADMGVEIVEERMLRFIVQEIHNGKSLQEALNEPYVLNNTKPEWRRQILDRPEIVHAVEEELEKTFKSQEGGSGIG
jgi:gamma-glutamyltranspeptidase